MSGHTTEQLIQQQSEQHEADDTTIFGFWVYLMTDCVLFASLFAAFVVLRSNTFGGPSGHELFSMPYVLVETLLLLTSSFTCGLALLSAHRLDKPRLLRWLLLTGLLGLGFLGMEISEFHHLASEGNSWHRSGFLSAYFTLVGTHGLHITAGLIWLSVLFTKTRRQQLSRPLLKRLTMFSLFWHFLDLIWIFIFTVVYLFGALSS